MKRVPSGIKVTVPKCLAYGVYTPDYPVYLSSNMKTGYSLNTSRDECARARVRTPLCAEVCYAKFPPIAWYEGTYRRNSVNIRRLASAGATFDLAVAIAAKLHARGVYDLRFCGSGELFPELLDLADALTYVNIVPWGFTRNPFLLERMAKSWRGFPFTSSRPIFHGSIDRTTPESIVSRLEEATAQLLGRPSLAYLCTEPGWIGQVEVDQHPHRHSVRVVFGQHGGGKKTKVWHHLECPATGGQDIHCHECRRCLTLPPLPPQPHRPTW